MAVTAGELLEENTEDIVTGRDYFSDGGKPIEDIGTDYNFKRVIRWELVFYYTVVHMMALYGFFRCFHCQLLTILYTIILFVLTGQGITLCAHRYYAHRSFKATVPLRILLVCLNTLGGQFSLYRWVRDHRQHHKYSDTDADPHNANRGFFFSHCGWIMSKRHPMVLEKGKNIDMSDIEADWVVMFQKRYYIPLWVTIMAVVTAIPVWLWSESFINAFFVSGIFRWILFMNFTMCVNSWAHFWGTKPYNKYIRPVETALLSFFVMGEGWHNYHHNFPWDYRAAEFGLHYSFTTFLIDVFHYLGLAYDLKTASHSMVEIRAKRKGDGSHKLHGYKEVINENDRTEIKLGRRTALA